SSSDLANSSIPRFSNDNRIPRRTGHYQTATRSGNQKRQPEAATRSGNQKRQPEAAKSRRRKIYGWRGHMLREASRSLRKALRAAKREKARRGDARKGGRGDKARHDTVTGDERMVTRRPVEGEKILPPCLPVSLLPCQSFRRAPVSTCLLCHAGLQNGFHDCFPVDPLGPVEFFW